MEKIILIKYGELTTKKNNRNIFINTLCENIKKQLKNYNIKIIKNRVRMFIETDDNIDEIVDILKNVFGIHGIVVAYKVDTNIDVIKTLEGQFDADEIINMFRNFYYQRMILDITALKDYTDIKNLQKLSIALDMEKLILVLTDDEASALPSYLSKLISMGIYNFTRNVEGVLYLLNNPNSYRDVAQYHQLEDNQSAQVIYQGVETNYCRIIGIKNVTLQAGATTLAYMLVKSLKRKYNVVGVEVDDNKFNYYTNFFTMLYYFILLFNFY